MAGVTRLNVNVNEECANALKAYAAAHGCTVTEPVRRAISLLNHLDVQQLMDGDGDLG